MVITAQMAAKRKAQQLTSFTDTHWVSPVTCQALHGATEAARKGSERRAPSRCLLLPLQQDRRAYHEIGGGRGRQHRPVAAGVLGRFGGQDCLGITETLASICMNACVVAKGRRGSCMMKW